MLLYSSTGRTLVFCSVSLGTEATSLADPAMLAPQHPSLRPTDSTASMHKGNELPRASGRCVLGWVFGPRQHWRESVATAGSFEDLFLISKAFNPVYSEPVLGALVFQRKTRKPVSSTRGVESRGHPQLDTFKPALLCSSLARSRVGRKWVRGVRTPSPLKGLWFNSDVKKSHIPNISSAKIRIYDWVQLWLKPHS